MSSYDAWKTRTPDDDWLEDCDHADADIDVFTGTGKCLRCGELWWASADEIEAQRRHEQEYAAWVAEQERPWNRLKRWLARAWVGRRIDRARWRRQIVRDSEVPF